MINFFILTNNFKYPRLLIWLWQLKFGGFPTTGKSQDFTGQKIQRIFFIQTRVRINNSSLASNISSINNNLFIPILSSIKCNYGGCSSVVECETVALETRVRFPPPACLNSLKFGESKWQVVTLSIFIVPKNSGLEICNNYIKKYISDKTKIIKVRGEDVPPVVEKLSKLDKNVIGITGEDLFYEYSLKENSIIIKEKINWNNNEFIFKKPALCLLGPESKSLKELPQKIKICINKKYKNLADKFLKEYFKKDYEITYASGATEELFSEGIVDLVIDIICSGKSAKKAGLKVYEKIFESDIVVIEYSKNNFDLQKLYNLICEKTKSSDEKSYTKKLIANPNELKRKLIEEAGEVVTADSKENLIWECCDLIYFLFVIMANENIKFEDLNKENERRNKETLINKQNLKKESET